MIAARLRHLVLKSVASLFPVKWKEHKELQYWENRKREEEQLRNGHYEFFYTDHFGLSKSFFAGKKILDIGCGPRGSLEWADMADERIGLDPLAYKYLKLGADAHAMRYVRAYSEDIPFENGYFDVVCSFNSLDHVDDLNATIQEIKRVLSPGGLLLLLTDVNHDATDYEPQEYSWDIVDAFRPELRLIEEQHFEKSGEGMYQSIKQGVAYDHSDPSKRYGILSVKLQKRSTTH